MFVNRLCSLRARCTCASVGCSVALRSALSMLSGFWVNGRACIQETSCLGWGLRSSIGVMSMTCFADTAIDSLFRSTWGFSDSNTISIRLSTWFLNQGRSQPSSWGEHENFIPPQRVFWYCAPSVPPPQLREGTYPKCPPPWLGAC